MSRSTYPRLGRVLARDRPRRRVTIDGRGPGRPTPLLPPRPTRLAIDFSNYSRKGTQVGNRLPPDLRRELAAVLRRAVVRSGDSPLPRLQRGDGPVRPGEVGSGRARAVKHAHTRGRPHWGRGPSIGSPCLGLPPADRLRRLILQRRHVEVGELLLQGRHVHGVAQVERSRHRRHLRCG